MVCDKISQISIVALSSPTFLILILSLKSKDLNQIFIELSWELSWVILKCWWQQGLDMYNSKKKYYQLDIFVLTSDYSCSVPGSSNKEGTSQHGEGGNNPSHHSTV